MLEFQLPAGTTWEDAYDAVNQSLDGSQALLGSMLGKLADHTESQIVAADADINRLTSKLNRSIGQRLSRVDGKVNELVEKVMADVANKSAEAQIRLNQLADKAQIANPGAVPLRLPASGIQPGGTVSSGSAPLSADAVSLAPFALPPQLPPQLVPNPGDVVNGYDPCKIIVRGWRYDVDKPTIDIPPGCEWVYVHGQPDAGFFNWRLDCKSGDCKPVTSCLNQPPFFKPPPGCHWAMDGEPSPSGFCTWKIVCDLPPPPPVKDCTNPPPDVTLPLGCKWLLDGEPTPAGYCKYKLDCPPCLPPPPPTPPPASECCPFPVDWTQPIAWAKSDVAAPWRDKATALEPGLALLVDAKSYQDVDAAIRASSLGTYDDNAEPF